MCETKVCSKCKQELPLKKFTNANGGGALRPECNSCAYKQRKLTDKLTLENPLENPLDYNCPICVGSYDELKYCGGKNKENPWATDHDHDTKLFRGYLCHTCNRGLGIFSSLEKLERAKEYLRNHA